MYKSNPQTGLAPACSPQPAFTEAQMSCMLDTAAEQMMVHKDFQAAFETCVSGLEILVDVEREDSRCGDFKAGFCILGIQALAEMNQWHGVFSWVLQQYEHQEKIPAKIMQMCILLYSTVGEPAAVQEAARVWLHCPSNGGAAAAAAGFATVAELYLLHVLVPLGLRDEAVQLIAGEVGRVAFTEEQRRAALDVVGEKERPGEEPPLNPDIGPDAEIPARPASSRGSVLHKLEAMLRFLCRKVSSAGRGSFPLRRLFLAAVLLYALLFRMDTARPSSFVWISKLLQLLRQLWTAMFAPYYQALTGRP